MNEHQLSHRVPPIIVLGPDVGETREVAGWLRSAGLGAIATARTCDEALFALGRQNVSLIIIDDRMPAGAEQRLLRHIEGSGHRTAPAMVRLVAAAAPSAVPACERILAESVFRPLSAHELVVRVGAALQRPDLVRRLDRDRDQAGVALATARRMQFGLLPSAEQVVAVQAACGVGLDAFCRPGEAVGGDFWGAWPTGPGCFAVAVVDFAGHGLGAALNTFRLHAILAERTLPRAQPVTMTMLLNERLHALLPRGQYATMIYANIDAPRRQVVWCSAGGPPPLYVTPGASRDLKGSGLPLGVKAEADYVCNVADLPDPGIICIFSDGLYEGGPASPDIPRGALSEALASAAALAASGNLQSAARNATQALQALRDRHPWHEHSDDVMVVCAAVGPRKELLF